VNLYPVCVRATSSSVPVFVCAGTLESELDVDRVHHLSPTEQHQHQQQQQSVGGGSARTGPGDSDQEREDDLAEVAEALG
jgi:hypothetical protein